MRLEPLPRHLQLAAAAGDEREGDEGARHEVDHGGLRHVQSAHDDLADGEADDVADHGRREVAAAHGDALGVVHAQREAEQQAGQHDVPETYQGELCRDAGLVDERHQDLDGHVEAGRDHHHDVLAEDGGGDEDPEDVVEEGEDEEGARDLEARQPDAGEEEDDEGEGEEVVEQPALGHEPPDDGGDADGGHVDGEQRHRPQVRDFDFA
mmetsp:Transcript_67680/g.180938  ORF Transcript_67680/g.180938 Transcript_67680/m.180938 type:complete len:209 (+) Transcript_67680:93-719(+)